MLLKSIKIINFKSIKKETIQLSPKCRVLVGINESGKTNILNAIKTLSKEYTPDPKDQRQCLDDEPLIEESQIEFFFVFNPNETARIYERVSKLFLTKDINSSQLKKGKNSYTLKDFCTLRNSTVYTVNIKDPKKYFSYYKIEQETDYSINTKWKKIKDDIPDDASFINEKNETIGLKPFKFVNTEEYPNILPEYLENYDIVFLNKIIGTETVTESPSFLPEVIFWNYSEEYLLPNSKNVDEFIADPESCIPLKNLFLLAGVKDIPGEITRYRSLSIHNYRAFLKNICNKATTFFQSVWKDYKNIKFAIEIDGPDLLPVVRDKIDLEFSKRSDGFKRFVSFLLMISVKVKKDLIKDAVLLIDEPEISLHPSGAKYLRDELLNISKNNYVIYSTHSIFMIDNENIERHLIIKKNDDVTTIEIASNSNLIDEDVLYKALGYTIFDPLKKKNILFEGWRDKKLFKTAMGKLSPAIRKKYKNIGICHGNGVVNIKNLTPIIELTNNQVFILSDADEPAKRNQSDFIKNKYYGKWMRYDEVDPSVEAITGEDFIDNTYIEKAINKAKLLHSSLITAPNLKLTNNKGKLEEINQWLTVNGISSLEAKTIIEEIKTEIFKDIKPKNIDLKYIEFLKHLSSAI